MSSDIKNIKPKILWLEADRFDEKPNKGPWLEMSRVLIERGFDVVLLTGFGEVPYSNPNVTVISFYIFKIPFIFRIALLMRILLWVIRNGNKGDIVILKPDSLFLAPILRLFGYENIHLDIRTLPVCARDSLKTKIDNWLFWKFTLNHFRKYVSSCSLITERLKLEVEKEFGIILTDYVIWQSGVNTKLFRPAGVPTKKSDHDPYILFYHGSIYGRRGFRQMLEAIALLDDEYKNHIRLVIVGPESGDIHLNDIIKEYGIAEYVIVEGLVPYEEIPLRIAEADCCICPLPDLLEWNVSSPLKIFEYMACAKPIVLTPIPAHQDIALGLKSIIWANGYDSRHLKEAIQKAFDRRQELIDASMAGLEIVRSRYDWEVQGARFYEYLNGKYCS